MHANPSDEVTRRHWDPYRLVLLALIAIYVAVFVWLAFDLHAGMRTHKSDLGQMDQAVWNTSHGRFVERVDDEILTTRMTDHVEPIFALVAPVFWLWDDVRAILLLQVLLVALGAWPLFELARRKTTPLVALALAAAYLLNPALQSAVLTEFHAIPLAVPLILWAFWAVEAERWGQLVVAALLVASVKEEAAPLAAGLGVWAIWRGWLGGRKAGAHPCGRPRSKSQQKKQSTINRKQTIKRTRTTHHRLPTSDSASDLWSLAQPSSSFPSLVLSRNLRHHSGLCRAVVRRRRKQLFRALWRTG